MIITAMDRLLKFFLKVFDIDLVGVFLMFKLVPLYCQSKSKELIVQIMIQTQLIIL